MNAPDFIIIPHQLILDKRLNWLDRSIFGIVYWFTKMKGEKCFAGNKIIAELSGAQNNISVSNSLQRLEEFGYIKRVFKDENKKVRQEIICLVSYAKVSFIDDRVSSTDESRVSSTDEQNKNNNNKNIKKESFNFETIKNHKLWPQILEKYPDRDYEFQFEAMMDWWKNKKRKPPKTISAFINWISKLWTIDPKLVEKRVRQNQQLQMEEDRKKMSERAPVNPKAMQELRQKMKGVIKGF